MQKVTPGVVLFVSTLLAALGCIALGEREIALMLVIFATGHAVASPFKPKPSELNPTPGIERVDGEQ